MEPQARRSQATADDIIFGLSDWAWGGRGSVGVDEQLRSLAAGQAEIKAVQVQGQADNRKANRILAVAVVAGMLLANPLTAHLAEPWLKALGK